MISSRNLVKPEPKIFDDAVRRLRPAFFFKGFTGLTITIGSILTLFVVMQMTARIRWDEKFRALAANMPLQAMAKNSD